GGRTPDGLSFEARTARWHQFGESDEAFVSRKQSFARRRTLAHPFNVEGSAAVAESMAILPPGRPAPHPHLAAWRRAGEAFHLVPTINRPAASRRLSWPVRGQGSFRLRKELRQGKGPPPDRAFRRDRHQDVVRAVNEHARPPLGPSRRARFD